MLTTKTSEAKHQKSNSMKYTLYGKKERRKESRSRSHGTNASSSRFQFTNHSYFSPHAHIKYVCSVFFHWNSCIIISIKVSFSLHGAQRLHSVCLFSLVPYCPPHSSATHTHIHILVPISLHLFFSTGFHSNVLCVCSNMYVCECICVRVCAKFFFYISARFTYYALLFKWCK